MTANKFIAEVDAPEFGEGYTIRLDMDGHGRIESIEGTKPFQIGQALLDMHNGLGLFSIHYIKLFLSVALRDRTGAVQPDLPPMPDVSLSVIGRKCQDAFALFRYGKMHDQWMADNENEQPQKAAAANPLKATKA